MSNFAKQPVKLPEGKYITELKFSGGWKTNWLEYMPALGLPVKIWVRIDFWERERGERQVYIDRWI